MKLDAYWKMGDLKSAEPLLANSGVDPIWRGAQAFFQRNYVTAAEIFSKTAANNPQPFWPFVFSLGICQQRMGNMAAARATFQGAVEGIQR